jgi:hypothetical protein
MALGFGGEPDLGIRGLVDFNRVLRGWTDPESAESAHLSTGSSGGDFVAPHEDRAAA